MQINTLHCSVNWSLAVGNEAVSTDDRSTLPNSRKVCLGASIMGESEKIGR